MGWASGPDAWLVEDLEAGRGAANSLQWRGRGQADTCRPLEGAGDREGGRPWGVQHIAEDPSESLGPAFPVPGSGPGSLPPPCPLDVAQGTAEGAGRALSPQSRDSGANMQSKEQSPKSPCGEDHARPGSRASEQRGV